MKTQSVSFQGGLNARNILSPQLRDAVEKSPAAKRFGMFYNADVVESLVGSKSKKDVAYSGLFFDNIRPRNIFVGLFDFITGRSSKRYKGFYFVSGHETENGLISTLGKLKKNTFLKMVKEK